MGKGKWASIVIALIVVALFRGSSPGVAFLVILVCGVVCLFVSLLQKFSNSLDQMNEIADENKDQIHESSENEG